MSDEESEPSVDDDAIRAVTAMSVTEALRVGQAGEEDEPGPGRILFSAAVMLIALYLVYTAREFGELPRIMPLTFGIPMLMLSAVQFVREILHWRQVRDKSPRGPFSWQPMAYFVGAAATVLALGTILGGAVLLSGLTLWYGKRSIRWSLFVGAAGGLTYYVLVTLILGAPHYSGMFW